MLFKPVNKAGLALLLFASTAQAQSLAQLGGPANLPPSDFTGQQFVDARGCLFMRAGFGANVTWIPRVDAGHKPICGYPPTFSAATLAAVEADMAPVSVAMASPPSAPVVAEPTPNAPARPKGGFWAALFRPATVPRVTAPAAPAAPVAEVVATAPVPVAVIPTPPKGYRLAWTDDRLNPMRGIGTAEGQAQQDRIWTRQVPAHLVTAKPAAKAAGKVVVSTMSAPEPRPGGNGLVQVGCFGNPANVTAAMARLTALGLPVTSRQITSKGRQLTVVYAGPFGAAEAAQAALATARAAGFGDAILRMN